MIRTHPSKIAVFLTPWLVLVAGCIGLGTPGPLDGTPSQDGNGVDPGDDRVDLAVTLLVSNPAPRPFEQVNLRCSLDTDSFTNVTFSFQPAVGRLVVDRTAGTARFIVDESDVGVALTFTCTASDENGESQPSNSQTIIASP